MDVAANASETDEKTEDVEATVEKKEQCNTTAEGKKEEGKATEGPMETEETSNGEGTSKEDVESQKNADPGAEKENVNPNTSTPDTSEGVIKSTLNLLAKKIRGD